MQSRDQSSAIGNIRDVYLLDTVLRILQNFLQFPKSFRLSARVTFHRLFELLGDRGLRAFHRFVQLVRDPLSLFHGCPGLARDALDEIVRPQTLSQDLSHRAPQRVRLLNPLIARRLRCAKRARGLLVADFYSLVVGAFHVSQTVHLPRRAHLQQFYYLVRTSFSSTRGSLDLFYCKFQVECHGNAV